MIRTDSEKPTSGGAPILECREVSRNFTVATGVFSGKKSLRAVDQVSFAIRHQDVLSIPVAQTRCRSALNHVPRL